MRLGASQTPLLLSSSAAFLAPDDGGTESQAFIEGRVDGARARPADRPVRQERLRTLVGAALRRPAIHRRFDRIPVEEFHAPRNGVCRRCWSNPAIIRPKQFTVCRRKAAPCWRSPPRKASDPIARLPRRCISAATNGRSAACQAIAAAPPTPTIPPTPGPIPTDGCISASPAAWANGPAPKSRSPAAWDMDPIVFDVRDVSQLDPSAVLGMFTWDDTLVDANHREMDIEISRWGDPGGKNAQYVVQPYYVPANMVRFSAPAGRLTYSFHWQPGRVSFKTARSPAAESRRRTRLHFGGSPARRRSGSHEPVRLRQYAKVRCSMRSRSSLKNFEYLP